MAFASNVFSSDETLFATIRARSIVPSELGGQLADEAHTLLADEEHPLICPQSAGHEARGDRDEEIQSKA